MPTCAAAAQKDSDSIGQRGIPDPVCMHPPHLDTWESTCLRFDLSPLTTPTSHNVNAFVLLSSSSFGPNPLSEKAQRTKSSEIIYLDVRALDCQSVDE